jgi:hypothetical protein
VNAASHVERVLRGSRRVMQVYSDGKECGIGVGITIYLREWLSDL